MRLVIHLSNKHNKQVFVNAFLFGYRIESKHHVRGFQEIFKLDNGSQVKHSHSIFNEHNFVTRQKLDKEKICKISKLYASKFTGQMLAGQTRNEPNTKNEFVNINLQTFFGILVTMSVTGIHQLADIRHIKHIGENIYKWKLRDNIRYS